MGNLWRFGVCSILRRKPEQLAGADADWDAEGLLQWMCYRHSLLSTLPLFIWCEVACIHMQAA